jgi:hypothetical protein
MTVSSVFIFLASVAFSSVEASNRSVELQWYGYSLCQFCFEGANVVGNALEIDGINEQVSFTYLPVNHWDSDGNYACTAEDDEGNTVDLDCEGTAFESCLVNLVCWYGDCDAETQQSLATFLKCYEGPGANSEEALDPETRQPCLEAANFPSPNDDVDELISQISACQNDPDVLDPILETLNNSKASMVASTDYTVFPIFYVNDEYQKDSTWTALTRTFCDLSAMSSVPECAYEVFQLNVQVSNPSDPNLLIDAIALSLNLAASNASLPIHFDTDDDALTQPDEFTYVNVNAIIAVIPGKCEEKPTTTTSNCRQGIKVYSENEEEDGGVLLGYNYEFEAQILNEFEQETIDFVNNANDLFLQYLDYAFQELDIDNTVKKASA